MVSAKVGQIAKTSLDKDLVKAIYGTQKKVPVFNPPLNPKETHAPGFAAGLSVAIFLVVLVTCARLGIRYFHKRMKLGLDDLFIVPAAIFVCAYLTTLLVRVSIAGAGRHLDTVTYHEMGLYFGIGNVGQILFYCGVSFTKMSIIMFNRRLTGISSKPWRIAHDTFLVVIVCFFLSSFFLNVFQCSPARVSWDWAYRGRTKFTCVDKAKQNNYISWFHAASDIILLSVPIIVLWKVKLPWTTKFRLFFVFALASISVAGAVIRLITIQLSSKDSTYVFTNLIGWTITDITLGVIVASLPALNPLIDLVWPKSWSTRKRDFSSLYKSGSSKTGSSANRSRNAAQAATSSDSSNSVEDEEKAHGTPRLVGGEIHRKDEVSVGYQDEKEAIASEQARPSVPHGAIPDSLRNQAPPEAEGRKFGSEATAARTGPPQNPQQGQSWFDAMRTQSPPPADGRRQ
ncbi:MAG: hypothetical protein M1814_003732 [Vezdaea aestivalis]|nr:MAG: hypothetical protein M1814_003732 [Vezdaea aestivalis]